MKSKGSVQGLISSSAAARQYFAQRLHGRLPKRPRVPVSLDVPKVLLSKLENCALLESISGRALKQLLADAEWFCLPGGTMLKRDGENQNAVFLVLSGSLGVLVRGESGEETLVATVPAGETVGEMSVLSGETPSADLAALRDTELLRLTKPVFQQLLLKHPRVMFNLNKILIRRLRNTTRRVASRHAPKTFSLVPLQPGLDIGGLSRALTAEMRGMGLAAIRIDKQAHDDNADLLQRAELEHDFIIYEGGTLDSAWTQLCVRQADRLIYVAGSARDIPPSLQQTQFPARRRKPEMIILHESSSISPGRTAQLLGATGEVLHHHVRQGNASDVARVARSLAGRAISVVLGGGGARGFAHIGVLRALKEKGVPFDFVAGASIGGIIAAGLALEWDVEDLAQRLKRTFVDTNPLGDYTLPLVALVRGGKVSRLLRDHFGDGQIEDLPRNFFCVSSNLTSGNTLVHRSGPIWRALRAGVAIPGILPPVVVDGQVLVDGGLMNNMPVDIMAGIGRGPIIGIDVSGDSNLTARADYADISLVNMIRGRMQGTPSIVSILVRSGTVGNEVQRRQARAMADMLFDPPLDGVGLRTWHSFDRAIEAGYRHAVEVLDKVDLAEVLKRGDRAAVSPALIVSTR